MQQTNDKKFGDFSPEMVAVKIKEIFKHKVMYFTLKSTSDWQGVIYVCKQYEIHVGDIGYPSFVKVSATCPEWVAALFASQIYIIKPTHLELTKALVKLRRNYTHASRIYLNIRDNHLNYSGLMQMERKKKEKAKLVALSRNTGYEGDLPF